MSTALSFHKRKYVTQQADNADCSTNQYKNCPKLYTNNSRLHLLSSGEESDERILRFLSDSTSFDSVKLSSKGTIKLLSNWHCPSFSELLLQTGLLFTAFPTLSDSPVKSKLFLLFVFSKFTCVDKLELSGGCKASAVAQFSNSKATALYSYQ